MPGLSRAKPERTDAFVIAQDFLSASTTLQCGSLVGRCRRAAKEIDRHRWARIHHSTGIGPGPDAALDQSLRAAAVHPMTPLYAPANVRDQFLLAIDAGNRALSTELAGNLTGCGNPLPSTTCLELGLPLRSTYACAAREVLKRKSN